MVENGFFQTVWEVTSDRSTCIEHVYWENQSLIASPEVYDCFYSDHKFVVVGIN